MFSIFARIGAITEKHESAFSLFALNNPTHIFTIQISSSLELPCNIFRNNDFNLSTFTLSVLQNSPETLRVQSLFNRGLQHDLSFTRAMFSISSQMQARTEKYLFVLLYPPCIIPVTLKWVQSSCSRELIQRSIYSNNGYRLSHIDGKNCKTCINYSLSALQNPLYNKMNSEFVWQRTSKKHNI